MAASESKTKENLLCHLHIDETDTTTANHLAELISEVLRQKPNDALEKLEQLSAFLKHYRFRPTAGADTVVPTPFPQQRLNAMEALQRSKVLYTGEADISHFSDDAAMLHWAGIGFGDQNNYDITLRVRALAQTVGKSLLKLRFWGKILGTSYDYLIAEGQLAPSTAEAVEDVEPRGKGANTYCYWALSSKPGADWELLPDVNPAWITASKSIRKYLTGDLNAPVVAFVTLENERCYLRAVIARISAACTLAPTGAFVPGEEEGTVQENAEFEFPATDELKTQAAWIHARDYILVNGQTKYPEVDPEVDEERAKVVDKWKEEDPAVPALRGIAEDAPAEEGSSKGWHASQCGDPSCYTFDSAQKSYAVSVLRSTRWPGAYTVCQGKRYCNIYVGYGLRDTGSCFFPLCPGDVQEEPQDDGDEANEPNPDEEVLSDQASEDEQGEGET